MKIHGFRFLGTTCPGNFLRFMPARRLRVTPEMVELSFISCLARLGMGGFMRASDSGLFSNDGEKDGQAWSREMESAFGRAGRDADNTSSYFARHENKVAEKWPSVKDRGKRKAFPGLLHPGKALIAAVVRPCRGYGFLFRTNCARRFLAQAASVWPGSRGRSSP